MFSNHLLCVDRPDVECDAYVPVGDRSTVCARCDGSLDHSWLHSWRASGTVHGPGLDIGWVSALHSSQYTVNCPPFNIYLFNLIQWSVDYFRTDNLSVGFTNAFRLLYWSKCTKFIQRKLSSFSLGGGSALLYLILLFKDNINNL